MVTQRTKQLLIVTTLLVIGVMAVLAFVVYLILVDGKKLTDQSQLLADQRVQAQTYIALDALLEKSETEREELDDYLLTEADTIDFLAAIEETAMEQDVELVTDALTVTEGKDFDTLAVRFSISGTQRAVEKMISILESLPYASALTSLRVAKATAKENAEITSTLELAVTLQKHDQ